VIFLENVKNLVNHDKGKTLKEILRILNELNYNVYYKPIGTENWLSATTIDNATKTITLTGIAL
jgi:hypothetical protein